MKKRQSILAIFCEFARSYPRQFIALFILLLIEGLASALSIMTLVPVADYLVDPSLSHPSRVTQIIVTGLAALGVSPDFWVLGALFVITNLMKGLLDVAIRYAILRIKYAVVRGLFGDALEVFFKARWEFFSGAHQGKLLNTLSKELSVIGDTLGHLATLFAQIFQLIIYLAVPIWLNAGLTLTALGLAMLFGAPFMLLHRLSYRLGKLNSETSNLHIGILSEVLGAARLILGFGRQEQARMRYLSALDEHTKVTLRSQTLSTAIPKFFQPLAMLAIVIALGSALKQQAHVSELAAVMWSLLAAMPLLSSLLQGNISISNFLPSYEQLIALRKNAKELEETQGQLPYLGLGVGIDLEDVSFAYPKRSKILHNINLHIRKGQLTALVGESGSGKSTITDLILGLQIPGDGRVLVDGMPLRDLKLNNFRDRVGYVPQDPQLFHVSIRENLLWSFDGASESDIWRALRLANAEEFVKELPQGIDTLVGDRGIRLSGGQRQRIALARALIRKPDLLILDEATSALDSESERLIQLSIDQVAKDTTILVVAHRLSTIAKAQQVYVLSKGRVIEKGAFSVLAENPGGILNAMIKAQLPQDIDKLQENPLGK